MVYSVCGVRNFSARHDNTEPGLVMFAFATVTILGSVAAFRVMGRALRAALTAGDEFRAMVRRDTFGGI